MRSAAGADPLAFCYFVADFERLVAAITHAAQYTVQRFHTGAHALRTGKELILHKVSCDGKNDDCSRGSDPAEAGICHLRKLLPPRRKSVAFAFTGLRLTTARDALMQMGFNQQCASRGKLAVAILRQQCADVFTSTDGYDLRGGRKSGFMAYALPHALSGGVHGFMVRLLGAHGVKRMIELFAWIAGAILFVGLHRVPFVSPLKSFFS